MKLKDIKSRFQVTLSTIYDKEEINSFFFILTESYYNISRLQLAMTPDYKVENSEIILKALNALREQKPIQYILGKTEFYGLPFNVNKHTLIPRPETEELVNWVLKNIETKTNKQLKILDIGTGSGCIAISLAKHLPNAKIYALDISKKALEKAKLNAKSNKVTVSFIEADIFNYKHNDDNLSTQKFDIIISNPPYVRHKEKPNIKPNVLDNEPHLALFVEDENPLKFYKAITEFAKKNLNDTGELYFEINEYLGAEMIELLKEYNFKFLELKQDFFKKDRMLKGINFSN